MVKIAKSYWDVGQYALGFRGAIGLLWLHKWNIRLFVVLVWMMKRELPQSICWILITFNDDILFLLTMTLCLSKVTIHSSSHNCPIEMILEWSLGKISACFAWLDNFLWYLGLVCGCHCG